MSLCFFSAIFTCLKHHNIAPLLGEHIGNKSCFVSSLHTLGVGLIIHFGVKTLLIRYKLLYGNGLDCNLEHLTFDIHPSLNQGRDVGLN